jgi:hypothetical protein
MCGADIPDVSELKVMGKEAAQKRSESKDNNKTPAATLPAGD